MQAHLERLQLMHFPDSFYIYAKTNMKKTEILGFDETKGAYVMGVNAEPEKGKANAEIIDSNIEYNEDKTIAEISGEVEPKGELVKENQIWIAAAAYHQGLPTGVRKWVSDDNLVEDEKISFQLYLYSLGPEIEKIVLFSELH